MTELYRFRSIEYLLAEYNELENQSIYFASPEELNDPLEGFRNIFWQGDKIVWCNFFKQYIYCLIRSIINPKTCSNVDEFELIIPVEERRDNFVKEMSQSPSTNFNDLLSDIYNRTFEKNKLDQLIIELGNKNRKVRTDEMLIYLRVINSKLIPEIYGALVAHGLEQEYQNPYKNMEPNLLVSTLVDMIQVDGDTEALEKFFEGVNQFVTDLLLPSKLTIHSKSQNTTEEYQHLSNVEFLVVDFPNSFLKQLVDRLVYPRWYTACFIRECNNSSLWAHYADGHKGVCLIFEANESAEGTVPTITLNKLSESSNKGEVGVTFRCKYVISTMQLKLARLISFDQLDGCHNRHLRSFGIVTRKENSVSVVYILETTTWMPGGRSIGKISTVIYPSKPEIGDTRKKAV